MKFQVVISQGVRDVLLSDAFYPKFNPIQFRDTVNELMEGFPEDEEPNPNQIYELRFEASRVIDDQGYCELQTTLNGNKGRRLSRVMGKASPALIASPHVTKSDHFFTWSFHYLNRGDGWELVNKAELQDYAIGNVDSDYDD